MTGGDQVAAMLAAEGVDTVFGIIDGSYFGLYSSLGRHGIRLITPRHEATAVHMAGAYARLTRRVGVCLASNGPGVANALGGVAVEQGEGNRVLLITSWRRSGIVGPDRGGTYQYFDQPTVIAAMAKSSEAVTNRDRLAEAMARAFRSCWAGRPGVVHVTIAEDVVNGPAAVGAEREPARARRQPPIATDLATVRAAAEMLLAAASPMIHAGTGLVHAGAFAGLARVAELLDAPVTTSWGGRDSIDERSLNSIPMYDIDLVNRVRNDSDCVLALGARFGETDWWGKPPYWRTAAEQKLIQVDLDELALGRNRPADIAVVADIATFLPSLAEMLTELLCDPMSDEATASRAARLAAYGEAQRAHRAVLDDALSIDTMPLHSSRVAPLCQEVFDDNAVLVIDGGNTAIWTNLYHQVRQPGTMLSTFKFGMLGAGVGQALGAKAADPTRAVYCIIGDGAMGFHSHEIETAVRCGLQVVFVVICDRQWGMVKVNQEFAIDPDRTLLEGGLTPEENINTDLGETRFDLLAEAMGAHGERVATVDELHAALIRSRDCGRCAVIHVDVDRQAHKFAPNLASFKDMHAEPGGS
ncbi:MAG TPA: thiamine pyrophosphate-binding protein [Ilumatobacteraceae bacterium]|nr:thiamine pyrophosphate-binding protein [Ilumatobacteraceae bacterium]